MTIKYLDSKRISGLEADRSTTTKTYDYYTVTGSQFDGLFTGNIIRGGIKIVSASPAIDTYIQKVKLSIKKLGSPSGNLTITVRDDSDTILASGTLATSSITTSYADYEITLDSAVKLAINYRVMGEYSGGDGSNNLIMEMQATTIETGYENTKYNGSAYSSYGTGYRPSFTFDSTPTSTAAIPTDIQDNSIFVETDTASRYWFDSVTATNSANFDVSSNDHIDIPTTGLTSLANGSVSFWLNLATDTTNTGDNVVFSGSNSSTGSSEWIIGYYGSTNKISVLSRNSGSNVLEYKAGTLTKGTWHHIVYTNNSSTGNKLYIDGSVVTPSYTQGSASTNSFMSAVSSINTCTIGSNKDSGGYQWSWDGNIQQVLVYGSTLTSSEVTALYNSGDYNSSPSTTNLLRRYELRVDANDTSGNGHNGTSTGVTFTATTIPNTPSTTTTTWTRELPTLPTISDLVLHLDANASSTITKDGNLVATWGDGSTVSNDITASGTARPTWVDDTQTGLPVIRFDGTNNIMTGTTASYSLPNTLFMVCTTPNTDSEGMFDGDTSRNLFNRQGTNTYRIYAGAGVTGGTANTAMQVFTVVFNNGSPALNINGSAQSLSGTNIGTSALDDIVLGAFDGNTGNADYDVCEVLFYNKALSTSEISSVESYLNKKWGVY